MRFFSISFLISFCLVAFSAGAQSFTGTPQTVRSQHSVTVNDVGENNSLCVINGKPAISYHAKTGGFYYIRSEDPSGAGWSAAPVLVNTISHSSPVSLSNLSAGTGNPMLAFNTNVTTAIRLKRASHADGDAWADPTSTIASRATMEMSLAVVGGFPAVSFYDPINYDLVYVRATDAGGTAWGTPVTLDNGASSDSRGRYSTLLVVDGRPAVAYYNTASGELMYIRANDASGTEWPAPQVVDTDGNNGRFASMFIVDGKPAIAYQNWTNNNLRYVRANDAAGSSWGTPLTLDSGDDTGFGTSLAFINGVPVISYLTRKSSSVELRFVRGSDAEGSGAWTAPQVLDVMNATVALTGFEYRRTSLAEVNGTPAISYYDFANKDLKYIRSNTPVFVQQGPPILYVKVEGTGDGSSWADAMGDIQAAVNSPGAEQVWVAKGTYYPAGDGLKMKNGVAIYGGFPDDDDDAGMNERDWEANPTILHGNNERIVVNNEFEVSEPLLASAILDGFTITKGNFTYASGMVNIYASPRLNNLVITENISTGEGGGMYNSDGTPTLINVSISGNSTTSKGGGIYNENASPVLTGVTISGNSSTGEGGGIYSRDSSPSLVNVTISGNNAGFGGGISNDNSSPVLTNVLIYGNSSSNDSFGGGGIYNGNGSLPTLINVTISDNSAFLEGGGIFNNSSSALIYNSIISNNGYLEYYGDLDPASSHNIIGGPDPLFVNPGGSDYRLSLSSPAINLGSNNAYGDLSGAKDLDDNPRLWGAAIDLGAYENQDAPVITITPGPGNILYVDQNVSGSDGSGSSWSNAIVELADALRYARTLNNHTTGDPLKIFVAKGTYKPLYHAADNSYTIDGNRHNSFVMVKNVQLYGGFAPEEGVRELSDERYLPYNTALHEQTVLSGNIGLPDDKSDNAYNVVLSVGDMGNATLNGFAVVGGNADLAEYSRVHEENVMRNRGGGINNWFSSPTLTHLDINGNSAIYGGGISDWNSSPSTTLVAISGNSAYMGGGINNEFSSSALTNLTISGNAAEYGGGIFNSNSTPTVTNVTINGNTALYGGNEWYNSAGTPVVRNSIIWGNGVFGELYNTAYSLVQHQSEAGNPDYYAPANHNLHPDTDPRFSNTATGDYTLLYCSPAINAGTPDITGLNLPQLDLGGQPRVFADRVDMGAFESLEVPYTGPGVARTSGELEREQVPNGTTDYVLGCNDWLASVTTTGLPTDLAGSTTVRVWIEDDPHPAQYVRRHYEIAPADNAGSATGRVTLYFTQADFDAFNDETEPANPLPSGPTGDVSVVLIEKRGGVSSDGTGKPNTYPGAAETISNLDVVWNQDEQRWEVSFDVTGFSGFFVKTTSSPLPVRWIAFSARLNDQDYGALEWKVDERSALQYEVERSADARNFSKVATIISQGDGLHEYRMTDPARATGILYYRIRQVDLDGSHSYSRIVNVAAPKGGRLLAYPNPATDKITVEIGAEYIGTKLQLINTAGMLLQKIDVDRPTLTLSMYHYPPGIYMLYTFDGSVVRVVRK